MEFKIKGCIGALMMGCVFAACEDDTDKGGSDVDQPKEATYLLYMVGQNDLKQYLNANISDMKIGYGKSISMPMCWCMPILVRCRHYI